MKKKVFATLLMLVLSSVILWGCGGGNGLDTPADPDVSTQEPEPTPEPEPDPDPETSDDVAPEGKARSKTSGEWIDEEIANNRPYAVMIGNTSDALPQFGLAESDVIYEAPVEGALTRLMAVIQDVRGLDKIGSVRSSRSYYIFWALDFDAIYVHFGQSIYAVPILARDDVDNLSGLDGSINSTFYRDSSRRAPHNAMTSEEGLAAGVARKGYDTEYEAGYTGHYQFAKDSEPVVLTDGEDALVVSPGYQVNKPWFVYDEATGLYNRFQYRRQHIDGGTNAQLAVNNIFIQYNSWRDADGNGYLEIDSVGSGNGKYITGGKMIDITWKKDGDHALTRYYDASGEEITINQGKTWVCVMLDNAAGRFKTYNTQAELEADNYN